MIWSGDNDGKFPMQVAATNDAMMELISHGNAYVLWQTFSNELGSPMLLVCMEDKSNIATTRNFAAGFGDANISYFLNLDASPNEPQTIVVGDDNLLANRKPVQPGILTLTTNVILEWTGERTDKYHGPGNIVLADGSWQRTTSRTLQEAFQQSSLATNRWVIP